MRFFHYIWDFDGTLFDSYPHIAWALGAALGDFDVTEPAGSLLPWLKQSVTRAVGHFAQIYGLDSPTLRERYDFYEAHDLARCPVVPYDGARDVCRAITRRGGQNFLYTHRGVSAPAYLRQFGMDGLFAGAVTADDGFPPKPAPDAIRHILAAYGLDGGRTLMVGDRDIDVTAGTNAGVSGCLFDPDGFYPDFPAACTIRSFPEFADRFLK